MFVVLKHYKNYRLEFMESAMKYGSGCKQMCSFSEINRPEHK